MQLPQNKNDHPCRLKIIKSWQKKQKLNQRYKIGNRFRTWDRFYGVNAGAVCVRTVLRHNSNNENNRET